MAEGESLSQHAAAASQQALEMAGIAAEEVDLIILATSSPDDLFGSACQVSLSMISRNEEELIRIAAEAVDLIILATSNLDDLFGTACQVRNMVAGEMSAKEHPARRLVLHVHR